MLMTLKGTRICIPDRNMGQVPYFCDARLCSELKSLADKNRGPVIFMEEMKIFHGVFKDKSGRYFMWGPARLDSMSHVTLALYKHKHAISDQKYMIPKSSLEILANIMSIAYAYYGGECIKEEDILIEGGNQEEIFRVNPADIELFQLNKSEMNRIHSSLEYENKFISAVEQGDVTSMKKLMQVNSMDVDGIGIVAKSATKQMEYLCVSSVVLVSRAAIRGGLNPELAYDLSDMYMQKLEGCKTLEEMMVVTAKMQLDYTERVNLEKIRRRKNLYVENCKDFIAKNLRKHFRISEIADVLEVNRSYLSRIFSEQEGMTIQEYVSKERCEHAANMLKFTDYGISVIAEYFCFSTQSHFGSQFRKIYGLTPGEYRRENQYVGSFITLPKR